MAQVFECVFLICIEIIQSLRQINLGNDPGSINPNRFKVPTKALIKELSSRNDIDENFESHIIDLIEKRHVLIHRWFLENGLPSDDNDPDVNKLTELADEVENKCRKITFSLSEYVLKWLTGENDNDQNVKSFTERLHKAERMFHDLQKIK